MGNSVKLKESWNGFRNSLTEAVNTTGSVYDKIKKVIGIIVMVIYRLRAVFMAIPVVWYALKLAAYNMQNLPDKVGLGLQSSGEFAYMVSKELAVLGPLVLTGSCLVMMVCSRKTIYPWAVSIFTLVLPLLLLFSNIYPM